MILNYTTDVQPEKSIAQIIALLSKKGAESITQDFFGDGRVKAIRFVMRVGKHPVLFSLPCNVDGVAGVLEKARPYSTRAKTSIDRFRANQRKMAERIAWRILKDWTEAQIAMIETSQAEPAQVFMPYAQNSEGQTMYQAWMENTQKKLGGER